MEWFWIGCGSLFVASHCFHLSFLITSTRTDMRSLRSRWGMGKIDKRWEMNFARCGTSGNLSTYYGWRRHEPTSPQPKQNKGAPIKTLNFACEIIARSIMASQYTTGNTKRLRKQLNGALPTDNVGQSAEQNSKNKNKDRTARCWRVNLCIEQIFGNCFWNKKKKNTYICVFAWRL